MKIYLDNSAPMVHYISILNGGYMTKRSEVQSAVKAARQSGTCALSNGWSVRVERVYNMPRGGPMAAWKYIYYLVSPENKAFGGYDRADSFVSWATEYKRYAVNYAP